MILTPCADCEGTGIWENAEGLPDRPRTMDCDPCFGHGEFATVTCSACQAKTTIPGGTSVKGCTYDCRCERVMLIEQDGTTTDLYERMAQSITEAYGIAVEPNQIGYIEL